MRHRLRTLLILLAVLPPMLAGAWQSLPREPEYGFRPGMIIDIRKVVRQERGRDVVQRWLEQGDVRVLPPDLPRNQPAEGLPASLDRP